MTESGFNHSYPNQMDQHLVLWDQSKRARSRGNVHEHTDYQRELEMFATVAHL